MQICGRLLRAGQHPCLNDELVLCRMRFTGPPRSTLSGAALEAGVDTDTLASVSEQNFFGELTAQAELVHL